MCGVTADESADLAYHGDQAVAPGLVDLAVNVRVTRRPAWLDEAIAQACRTLAAYPDPVEATRAIAASHGRPADQVLLTAGATEAFGLIARAALGRFTGPAVVIHPQFTEPERALRMAGHEVLRHVLDAAGGFVLHPETVPAEAGIVVLGNPTNPTGVLHRVTDVLALARPGRLLIVDEAFMDAVPGQPASLASRCDVPGLIVVRSLTKTWGLAGLRIGYLLAPSPIIAELRAQQPPWAVSTPALAAAVACATERAALAAAARARRIDQQREVLRAELVARDFHCVSASRGPFLLVRAPDGLVCGGGNIADLLRGQQIAVRRGDTFPGLGPAWFRTAVRGQAQSQALLGALDALAGTSLRPSASAGLPIGQPGR
ncbi:MAG: threonine-phosphate decarboxylase [Micromonosporaceae bacterium]|nr:threonine-phosphate decarboxylase [Micromonosporaceae bacterium]